MFLFSPHSCYMPCPFHPPHLNYFLFFFITTETEKFLQESTSTYEIEVNGISHVLYIIEGHVIFSNVIS
jgi:hypothetical protein